jgi:diguanylate cyclase (GGDEF)-like protein/PAS domain S-box-containing protein
MKHAVSRPAPASLRLLVSAVVLALYYTSFPWAYDLLGPDVVDLGALPVAAVAGCFGVVAGAVLVPLLIAIDATILVFNGGAIGDAANIAHAILLGAMAIGFGTMQRLLRGTRLQAAELERSDNAMRVVLNNAPLLLYSTDASGRFIFREGRALGSLGHAKNNVGEDAREFYRREYPDTPSLLADLERALRGEHVTDVVRARGRTIEAIWTPVRDQLGRPNGTICVGHDVTERDEAERSRMNSEQRLHGIIDSALDAIITVDSEGTIVIFNAAAEKMFGRSAAEMIGHALDPLIPGANRDEHRALAAGFMVAGESDRQKRAHGLSGVRATGEVFPIQATLSRAVVDGTPLATVIVRDITEQVRVAQELERRALYDALTDLPSRALFDDRVDSSLARARRHQQAGAVLVMNIDNFQQTNETFGHDVGDDVLRAVGSRLRGELRDEDTLARLGGDVFALFLSADERGARDVAERLLESLARPLEIRGQRIEQSLSIGIAVFPTHGEDRVALVRRAEIAMLHAKRARRTYAVYAAKEDHSNPDGLALLSDLRAAIRAGEIELAYQPDVDMGTGRVLRVEALARWTHATRGRIGPDRFIPIAERSGLIGDLTRCVLEKAIAQAAEWRKAGIELPVAVNLSVHDLLDRGLPFSIDDLLRRYGVPARLLSVELTESLLMNELDRSVPTLSTLRSLGIEVAIDDFGTGYSSLKYLAHLPADRIKIDRSFISAMSGDRGAAAIVRAAIELAHDLRLEVVAEGVEAPQTWAQLLRMNADSVQGYLISRPLPPQEIPPFLAAYVPPLTVVREEAV